ncbi:hypothetical protein F5Y06DRAFT_271109 [Hypoxylon sp. FL0890]|nr:hypothetical protein F5Y06DRAFT_271109 [Hypoxylon sp. FL0890]
MYHSSSVPQTGRSSTRPIALSTAASTLLALAKDPNFQEAATTLANPALNIRELGKWRAMLFSTVKATFPSRNFTMPRSTFPNLKVLCS